MKDIFKASLFLALILSLSLSALKAQEKISLKEVISLKKMGFSDDDILGELKKSHSQFPQVTDQDIETLKKAGLGEKVISYILSTRPKKPDKLTFEPGEKTAKIENPKPEEKTPKKETPSAPVIEPSYTPVSKEALEWYHKGKELAKEKKWDEAIAACTQAINIDANYPQAYCRRAGAYSEKKDFKKAFADVEKAISLAPRYSEAINLRGVCRYVQEERGLALIDFAQARRLAPRYHWPYYNLGFVMIVEGLRDLGAENYSQFLRFSASVKDSETISSRREAWVFLDGYYGDQIVKIGEEITVGNFSSAQKLLKSLEHKLSLGYSPHWTKTLIHYEKSRLLLAQGQVDSGLNHLEAAVKGGFDIFMDILQDPLFQKIFDHDRFKGIYGAMRISPRDMREIYWLKGEIQQAHHDTTMMIIENIGRVDEDYTEVPQNTLSFHPTTSIGVRAYRAILRNVLRQQKWTVLRSDIIRKHHLLHMQIIRNMPGSGRSRGPSYDQKQLSRHRAMQRAQYRKQQIASRSFAPSGSSARMSCPSPGSYRVPKRSSSFQSYAKNYFTQGTSALQSKDYEGAVKYFTEALKLNPHYENAYINRCVANYHLKKFKKCMDDVNRLIQVNPQNPKGYHLRGCLYFELKDFQKALSDMNQSISLQPKDANGYSARAAVLIKLQKYSDALEDLKKCYALDPTNQYGYFNAACLYSVQGDTQQGLQYFQQALQYGFDDIELIETAPELDNIRGLPGFKEYLGYYSGTFAQKYYERGVVKFNQKKYREGIPLFTKALKFNSNFFEAHNDRGCCYYNLKDYTRALQDFTKATEANQFNYLGFSNRGNTLYRLKKYPEALESLQKALKLYPSSAAIYNDMGAVYLGLRRSDQVLPYLHKALKIDSKHKHGYISLGVYYSLKRDKERTLACIEIGLAFGYDPKELAGIEDLEWIRKTDKYKEIRREKN